MSIEIRCTWMNIKLLLNINHMKKRFFKNMIESWLYIWAQNFLVGPVYVFYACVQSLDLVVFKM